MKIFLKQNVLKLHRFRFNGAKNKSNLMVRTVQVEANLREPPVDHLHFRKQKC